MLGTLFLCRLGCLQIHEKCDTDNSACLHHSPLKHFRQGTQSYPQLQQNSLDHSCCMSTPPLLGRSRTHLPYSQIVHSVTFLRPTSKASLLKEAKDTVKQNKLHSISQHDCQRKPSTFWNNLMPALCLICKPEVDAQSRIKDSPSKKLSWGDASVVCHVLSAAVKLHATGALSPIWSSKSTDWLDGSQTCAAKQSKTRRSTAHLSPSFLAIDWMQRVIQQRSCFLSKLLLASTVKFTLRVVAQAAWKLKLPVLSWSSATPSINWKLWSSALVAEATEVSWLAAADPNGQGEQTVAPPKLSSLGGGLQLSSCQWSKAAVQFSSPKAKFKNVQSQKMYKQKPKTECRSLASPLGQSLHAPELSALAIGLYRPRSQGRQAVSELETKTTW